ncbi:MAG: hypothetical protein HYY18_06095 [Planctomycetes bacterium]|nr:hypothetical protein [Planctomycetota bacterium]
MKKKRGAAADALPLWEMAVREPGRKGLEAGVELAKHYEHREKNFTRALDVTRRLLERADLAPREREELGGRRERLERRVAMAGRRLRGIE